MAASSAFYSCGASVRVHVAATYEHTGISRVRAPFLVHASLRFQRAFVASSGRVAVMGGQIAEHASSKEK